MGRTAPGIAIGEPGSARLRFDDHSLMPNVLGQYDCNVTLIENRLGVTIGARGADVTIQGTDLAVGEATQLLHDLYAIAKRGDRIDEGVVDARIRAVRDPAMRLVADVDRRVVPQISIRTRLRTIVPRTPAQAAYMLGIRQHDMTFGLGPAGTGKTYIAVAEAVSALIQGAVNRIVLSRPAVEAGERLGFLPGDMKEKCDPYLRPLYDALHDCLPAEQVERRMASGEIEVAPIAFMRGRTLADAFVILDEAQNTTQAQMKMFLTRFGQNSRMVVCGDPNQTDLPGGSDQSGLADAVSRLEGVEGICMARFGAGDVVRHPIVGRVVEAYEG